MAKYLRIPHERLSPDALAAMLEEFASRDGTDYGEREIALPEKVEQLRKLLKSGELLVLFQPESEQWDLVTKDEAVSLMAG
ncbi:MAG: YheU family protein [Pseudomonadota bacterium]